MIKYLKEHENYILRTLASENDNFKLVRLQEYHKSQIGFLQQERLVHLLVTLFFGLFFLVSVFFTIVLVEIVIILLDLLFLILLIPYIIYYYKLEKGVQRWYNLYNMINDRIK